MVKRIDKTTDTPTLQNALAFYTERMSHYQAISTDDHSLAYYKLMVDYIKELLATRSTQCPTAN